MTRPEFWCYRIALRHSRLLLLFACVSSSLSLAQSSISSDPSVAFYQQLQSSNVIDKSLHVENATLIRDRVTITFISGVVYLSPPVAGKIRAAVFVGSGEMQAAPPPIPFEQENVRRLLKADNVDLDFRTAVLRFTDDT